MKYTGGRCAILMAKEYRVSATPAGVVGDNTLNTVGIAIVLPMPTSSLSLGFEKVQRNPKLKLAEVFANVEKTSLFVSRNKSFSPSRIHTGN